MRPTREKSRPRAHILSLSPNWSVCSASTTRRRFASECIRPVRYGLDIGTQFAHPCVYERYGEKQVAAGIYRDVIRFDHVARIAAGLADLTRAEQSRRAATGRT